MALSESDIIKRYFFKDHIRGDVSTGIGDDAAVIKPPAGMEIVNAIDTIVAGVHFPPDFAAADIGYRVLAVNLSDLAAMGAEPAWALLSLSLPTLDEAWLETFSNGFFDLAVTSNVTLAGGDLVRGPLAATVSLSGYVAAGSAVTRAGALPGDLLYVTGCPGAASRGLLSLQEGRQRDPDAERKFCRPIPRVNEGIVLRDLAHAMIDVSDGLLTDAGHLATASGVSIELDYDQLKTASDGNIQAALTGGDDYELLFTIPAELENRLIALAEGWSCQLSRIGTVQAGSGLTMPGHDIGSKAGFDHFRQ